MCCNISILALWVAAPSQKLWAQSKCGFLVWILQLQEHASKMQMTKPRCLSPLKQTRFRSFIFCFRAELSEFRDVWMLITVQFGIKDLCSAPGAKSRNPWGHSLKCLKFSYMHIFISAPAKWVVKLSQALSTLKDSLGNKTIVLLLTPFDVTSPLRPGCSDVRSLQDCTWIKTQSRFELLKLLLNFALFFHKPTGIFFFRESLEDNRNMLEAILLQTADRFRFRWFKQTDQDSR